MTLKKRDRVSEREEKGDMPPPVAQDTQHEMMMGTSTSVKVANGGVVVVSHSDSDCHIVLKKESAAAAAAAAAAAVINPPVATNATGVDTSHTSRSATSVVCLPTPVGPHAKINYMSLFFLLLIFASSLTILYSIYLSFPDVQE